MALPPLVLAPVVLAAAALMVLGGDPARAAEPATARPAAGPPQFLPIEAQWCLEAMPGAAAPGRCIQLEVARGLRQQGWGLMLRPPLGPLRGMWFPFTPAQTVSFWMHRTISPLDMVFVRDGRVIAIEAAAAPCPRLPCRGYGPTEPVDGVVELDAGEAERLGIRPGSPAPIRLNRSAP